jgi:hypothetical protein
VVPEGRELTGAVKVATGGVVSGGTGAGDPPPPSPPVEGAGGSADAPPPALTGMPFAVVPPLLGVLMTVVEGVVVAVVCVALVVEGVFAARALSSALVLGPVYPTDSR